MSILQPRNIYENSVFFSRKYWSPKFARNRLTVGRSLDIVDVVVRKATNKWWADQRENSEKGKLLK